MVLLRVRPLISMFIKSSSIWKYSDDALEIFWWWSGNILPGAEKYLDDDLEAPADLSCPLEICRRAIRCWLAICTITLRIPTFCHPVSHLLQFSIEKERSCFKIKSGRKTQCTCDFFSLGAKTLFKAVQLLPGSSSSTTFTFLSFYHFLCFFFLKIEHLGSLKKILYAVGQMFLLFFGRFKRPPPRLLCFTNFPAKCLAPAYLAQFVTSQVTTGLKMSPKYIDFFLW